LLAGCSLLAPAPVRARQFEVADSIVASGVRRGIFPGAVLVVGRAAGVLHSRGFGHRVWGEGPVPSPDSTLWDLASLTKVVGTTGAIMHLVEEGRVELNMPVVRYLPRFLGAGKDRVTLRMLLNHTSGLRSYLPFYRLAPTRDSAVTLLYREPLRHPPGARAEYSDLNFLLLGLLVERVTGRPLDRYVTDSVLRPAGLLRTTYHPSGPPALTAPTGRYHGTAVCCTVNDQNAARMGGAAGHAGLFSTGTDLAGFARLWLNHGRVDGRQIFRPATIDRFLTPDPAAGDRLLGWERANPDHRDDSAYGHLLSSAAFGHTGWTGTLIWIDPGQDLFLVLLTNRAYAPRIGRSIRALRGLRGALADAVVRAAGAAPPAH
jgi:CubicO group peptidase (beta-lactamase class C family)